ncbi:hypothetical protein D039_0251B, partial [Vibrio parahaemolyticus EKP-028]
RVCLASLLTDTPRDKPSTNKSR